MSRRDLTPEDAELWRYVTRNVTPYRRIPSRTPELAHRPSRERETVEADPTAPPARIQRPSALAPIKVGEAANMDHGTARRLKRGQLPIDARIDLHGLSLNQAHAALAAFIRGAHARGARCVVVVTGKGSRKDGESEGKIRRELPHWLNQPSLRSLILAVTEAHTRDGGTGAFYVLLRRRR